MPQTIAYLDCYSGISGDMLLGAWLDAGLPLETLRDGLRGLALEGYEIRHTVTRDHGITGAHCEILLRDEEQPERSFRDIANLLRSSNLTERVKERSIAIFRTLGEAEAKVHGVALEEIHFHEVGAVDSIIDIVGTAIALEELGIERLYASPLPLTRGRMQMAHGLMPLPAPATLELLGQVKAPWVPCPIESELVTPTGAAVLATLATFEMPAIAISQIGYGFGQKQLPWPNCLRVMIGTSYGLFQENQPHEHNHKHSHDHNHNHDHDHSHIHELQHDQYELAVDEVIS